MLNSSRSHLATPDALPDSVDGSLEGSQGRRGNAPFALPRTPARRTGSREESIHQRGDVRWVAFVAEASGRRAYRYAPTWAEAAGELASTRRAVQEHNPPPALRPVPC